MRSKRALKLGTQSIPISIDNEPLFDDELARQTAGRGRSKRTRAYTNLEDVVLCEAWMEIVHDPICGAEQKGGHFGGRFSSTSTGTNTWVITRSRVITMKIDS
jgi:hypothetical protein